MSIFSQRTVQDAVDAIEPLLTDGDLKHLLKRLQNPPERIAMRPASARELSRRLTYPKQNEHQQIDSP
jgi:hypothetical protein